MKDKRMRTNRQALKETALEIVGLSASVNEEMTKEDRYYVGVKLRSRIEILMQLHDQLIEFAKQPQSKGYSNPEQHPF